MPVENQSVENPSPGLATNKLVRVTCWRWNKERKKVYLVSKVDAKIPKETKGMTGPEFW